MMKKILFVNNNMKIGGVQKALLNMLKNINSDYDITLLLFKENGSLLAELPQNIKVINGGFMLSLLATTHDEAKRNGIITYFFRSLLTSFTKIFDNRFPLWLVMKFAKKLKDFDIAVSYVQNADLKDFYGGTNNYVINNVQAKKKITFVHCDFENYKGNSSYNNKFYDKFNKVVFLTKSCINSFLKVVPNFPNDKIELAPNFHDYNEIKKLADESPVLYDEKYFNIVTVTRLGAEKGLIRTLEVMKKLIREDYKFKWYIIGDGALKTTLKNNISDFNLDKIVIMEGEQKNPYRYMKNADLLLLPSFHEASPMVFNEAWCLKLPILSTETLSAHEIITDNNIGIVCENSFIGIYNSLKNILDKKEQLNFEIKDADNNLAYQKISDILGGD